jgi:hypothetical protein
VRNPVRVQIDVLDPLPGWQPGNPSAGCRIRSVYGRGAPFPVRRSRSRASLSDSEVMGCPTAY